MCDTGVGPSGERCLVQKCGCVQSGTNLVVTLLAAALRLDSLTIHSRANARLLSLARLRPLDYFPFSDSAFSLWFANNVLDCTILRDQVSATNNQHGLRVRPQQQAALGRPRRRGMAEEAERHVPPLVQLQPVCGMICLARAATCLTFLRSSFGGDVEMAQDEVSAQLPTKAKTRDH